jgi:hypothetical protein
MHVSPFLKFHFSFFDKFEATSINWKLKPLFLLSTYTVYNLAISKFESQLYQ